MGQMGETLTHAASLEHPLSPSFPSCSDIKPKGFRDLKTFLFQGPNQHMYTPRQRKETRETVTAFL